MTENIIGLDPKIVEVLGIDEAELRARFYQGLYAKGTEAYNSHVYSISLNLPGLEVFTVDWTASSSTPRAILQQWMLLLHYRQENARRYGNDANDQWLMELNKNGLKKFLEGYGSAALEASAFDTAVEAFDLTTEGGILNNEPVMQQLKLAVQAATSNGEVENVLSLAGILQNAISTHPSVTFAH